MQPRIKKIKTKRKSVKAFKGVCLRETVPDGYFQDAENMSSRSYPAVYQRPVRSKFENCAGVGSMYHHGEMVWTWGRYLFYGKVRVGEVIPGDKAYASLGAYVVIYPDKKILNTDTLELTDMEQETAVSSAVVSPSNADGTDGEETNYVKIAANGIGVGFLPGDGVRISGLDDAGIGGSYLLQTVTDDFLVVIAHRTDSTEITGDIRVLRKAPDLDFICALGNRIWGCSNTTREVRACRLGDPTNWEVFQGISTDSYAAVVPSPGVFTGCAEFMGTVIFFKEEEIIKLFGSKPSNFELSASRMPGVEIGASASIAFSNSVLFYKGLLGVYTYDGSVPVLISDMLGWGRYAYGTAGAVDGRYYISMLDREMAKYRLFVYDTPTGSWHIENGGRIRFFACTGSDLYMAGADGNIYAVNGAGLWFDSEGAELSWDHLQELYFNWYAVTGPIALCAPDRQYVSCIHIRFSMKKEARLTIAVRYQGERDFFDIARFASPVDEFTCTIPVQARRADSICLKLYGRGDCIITGIAHTYESGSDF